MALKDMLPPSDLLSRIDGVEAGLRQVKRIGRAGQYLFLVTAVLGVVVESGVVPEGPPGSWSAAVIGAVKIGTRLLLPLLVLVLAWSRFWIRQSRQPFRYTCSVGVIRPMEHSPVSEDLTWLSQDLKELLSQRLDRLRFVEAGDASEAAGQHEGHITIGGTYVVRAQSGQAPNGRGVEVMAEVGIGAAKSPKRLAHPVIYPSDPFASPLTFQPGAAGQPERVVLSRADYQAILERVYFSVATEIYQQIREDVERKVALMPTAFLAGQALYHEAEDYARSNTLNAYEQARELYEKAARCFDPSLAPLPVSRPRRAVARAFRAVARGVRWLRRRAATLWPAMARRDVACARAQLGFANMLLNRYLLAVLSGVKTNPIFEARTVAEEALARLDALPRDAPGREASRFEALVVLAHAHHRLGAAAEAEEQLRQARALDPARADSDATFLFTLGEVEQHLRTRLQLLRRAVEAGRRFEIAQFFLASATEQLWRSRPTLERTVAEMVLREYQLVLDINPGNIAAWANRGYMRWLLGDEAGQGDLRQAHAEFQAGRDYKAIKRETLVAELDHGLARIAAERGELEAAYAHYVRATSAQIGYGLGEEFSTYYFTLVSDVMVQRFDRYRATVESHLGDPARVNGVSPRVLNSVYAFVLNDYGECCYAYSLRSGADRYQAIAREAFELAVAFNPNYAVPHYNLARLATYRHDADATQRHAGRIERLEPKWPLGILMQVDALAERVRRDVATGEAAGERARQFQADLDALLATRDGGPASGQAERIANLRDHKVKAEREAASAFEAADATERDICRRTRQLVPHVWLWTPADDRGHRDFDWSTLSGEDEAMTRRWRQDLDVVHVQALVAYGDSLGRRPSRRPQTALLLKHLRRLYWSNDFTVLRALRDCVTPPESDEYNAAIVAVIEREYVGDPVHAAILGWFDDKWSRVERRVEVFKEAVASPGLTGELYAWLAGQLVGIATRPDVPEAVRATARAVALEAVTATCAASSATAPWQAALDAARLGRLDLARYGYERAMELDADHGRPRISDDELRAAAAAVQAAEPVSYTAAFGRFSQARGRADAPGRPRAEYLVMRAATRLLQGQIDEGVAELASLTGQRIADPAWPTSMAEPLHMLLDATVTAARTSAELPVARVDQAYYFVKDWLGSGAHGVGASLALARKYQLQAGDRERLVVAQATVRNYYPVVTPIALEVDGRLAAQFGLDEGSVAQTPDLPQTRERVRRDSGVRIPGVRVRTSEGDLAENAYLILVDEIPVADGTIVPEAVFVPDSGAGRLMREETGWGIGRLCAPTAPAGRWRQAGDIPTTPGDAGWSPWRYLLGHLERVLRHRVSAFLSIDEVVLLVEEWAKGPLTDAQAAFATELQRDHPAAGTRILRAALDEGVPLRSPAAILDGLRAGVATPDPVDALEAFRQAVRPWLPGNEPGWRHVRLGDDLVKLLTGGLSAAGAPRALTLAPDDLGAFQAAMRAALEPQRTAAVVAPRPLRPYVSRLLADEWPGVPVLAYEELVPSLAIRLTGFGTITLE